MRTPATFLLAAALLGATASAQTTVATAAAGGDPKPAATDSTAKPGDSAKDAAKESAKSVVSTLQPIALQYFRPLDRRAINTFETSKEPGLKYDGFKLMFEIGRAHV